MDSMTVGHDPVISHDGLVLAKTSTCETAGRNGGATNHDASSPEGGGADTGTSNTSSQQRKDGARLGVLEHKRTRRSKRAGRRDWKPYSAMTWEERARREKLEEEKAMRKVQAELEAAQLKPPAKRTGKKKRRLNEPCPPAPRNTNAFLIAEHSYDMPSPTPLPVTPFEPMSPGPSSEAAPYGFDKDYELAMYGDLDTLSKEELLDKLRQAYLELEDLRTSKRKLSADDADDALLIATLRTENASLKEQLAELQVDIDPSSADDQLQQEMAL